MKIEEYKKHLKSKGYEVAGDMAFLHGRKYNICSGYRNTIRGKEKTFWLKFATAPREV